MAVMVPRNALKRAKSVLTEVGRGVHAERIEVDDKVATVSIVGTGFRQHPWIAAKVFETLARERINLQMIVTSDLKISLVLGLADGRRAIRKLHDAFKLSKSRH